MNNILRVVPMVCFMAMILACASDKNKVGISAKDSIPVLTNTPLKALCFMERQKAFEKKHSENVILQLCYAATNYTMEVFWKRANEFRKAYPDLVFEGGFYVLSNHSLSEFMSRYNTFKKNNKNRPGYMSACYASSNYQPAEFTQRYKEMEAKYQNVSFLPGLYAASTHSSSEFLKRFNEFNKVYPKRGILAVYYAYSINSLCK